MSELVHIGGSWSIGYGAAFRFCFAFAALAGAFLAILLTARFSRARSIAAGLTLAVLSWLLIAVLPVPVGVFVVIVGHTVPAGWLAVPALLSVIFGAALGVLVLRTFGQKADRATFGKLLEVNLAMVVFTCYGVERRTRPPLDLWDPDTGRFCWGAGQVTLPAGFSYHRGVGDNNVQGYFTSADGPLRIEVDIGGYAGSRARRDGSAWFEEKMVDGARVWVAKRCYDHGRTCLVGVTFPDTGSADFYTDGASEAEAAAIRSIARSFRPMIAKR